MVSQPGGWFWFFALAITTTIAAGWVLVFSAGFAWYMTASMLLVGAKTHEEV